MNNKINKILIAVDYGYASKQALAAGKMLAKQNQAKCTILHVLPITETSMTLIEPMMIPPPVVIKLETMQEKSSNFQLASMIEDTGFNPDDISVTIARNNAIHEILKQCTEHDILIIGLNQRHFIGSGIAEKICRRIPIPMLATPSAAPHGEYRDFRCGVIAADGSRTSKNVATQAISMMHPQGTLEFVHVIDSMFARHIESAPTWSSAADQLINDDITEKRIAFDNWYQNLNLPIKHSATIANIPPHDAVIERALETNADFIACGCLQSETRFPSGVVKMLLRHSPVPVFVVPEIENPT